MEDQLAAIPSPYLTAPIDRPRTSLSCAAHPASRTGRHAIVAAADKCAMNGPSGEIIPAMKTGTVAALTVVRLTARKNSFQAKMKQISAVAASPGLMIRSEERRVGKECRS